MIYSRSHMTEDTKKALEKAKREIRKLTYVEFDKAKEISNQVYEENRKNEWFEKLRYYDKMQIWLKKRRYEVWEQYLKEIKVGGDK